MAEPQPEKLPLPTISQLSPSQAAPSGAAVDVQRNYAAAARKTSSALRVSASIVAALAVSPGVDADEAALAAATAQIVDRAGQLTDVAMRLAAKIADAAAVPGYKALFRQQAVEFASDEWQEAHSGGREQFDAQKFIALYEKVVASKLFVGAEDLVPLPHSADPVMSRRIALMSAIPGIYKAIASFDYFVPDDAQLVADGVSAVMQAAERGGAQLVHESHRPDLKASVMQSLITEMASLYASNYRAQSRKAVRELSVMEDDERLRHLVVHRMTGLPTQHITHSFERLADRVVKMVFDAVPELAITSNRPAPVAPPSVANESPASSI